VAGAPPSLFGLPLQQFECGDGMPVIVVNRHSYKGPGIYIGRGKDPRSAPFGNPFTERPLETTLAKFQVASREEAIARYRMWVREQWESDAHFRRCLIFLVKKHLRGEQVVLICSCAPKPCHGDVLKELIEQMAELKVVALEDKLADEESPTLV